MPNTEWSKLNHLQLGKYADLKGAVSDKPKNKVVITAERLTHKGSIERIKKQEKLIFEVQTDEYWKDADMFNNELVRIAFRDLIKFLDNKSSDIYYTDFADEIIEWVEKKGEYSVNNMQSYRKKVEQYLKSHYDDIVVYKLRNNKSISEKDVKHLEKILWHDLGSKMDHEREYGDESLLKLVIQSVGLDSLTANEMFSKFLSDESLNVNQMEFVKMIINYVITNGIIDKKILNEHPFTKYGQ